MKIREVCEQVEDVIVEATGGLREEAEARRGEIARGATVVRTSAIGHVPRRH